MQDGPSVVPTGDWLWRHRSGASRAWLVEGGGPRPVGPPGTCRCGRPGRRTKEEGDVDWFRNAVFTPGADRDEVGAGLDEYVTELRAWARRHVDAPVGVFLSGSLARREPGVMSTGHGGVLLSDLDLVVIAAGEELAQRIAGTLKAEMLERRPDLTTTTFAVDVGNLRRLRGSVAADLAQGWDEPLYGSAPGPFPRRDLTDRDHEELCIHQLGACLFYPPADAPCDGLRHFRPGRGMHAVKSVLESLRLRVSVAGVRAPTYASLLAPESSEVLAAEQRDLAHRAIRARELGAPLSEFDDLAIPSVLAALSDRLGCSPTQASLARAVEDRVRDLTGVLPLFSALAVLLALGPGDPPLDAAIRGLLARTSDAELPTSRSARDQLVSAASPGDLGVHLPLWLDIREDYYTRLGDTNFGRVADPGGHR
ncbi:nucleotidyltransferase domain-containing protein [Clavibacter capsici]|uniref:nucleotidyltransferase domain-containing protein n=1 Tax=Clavibacter capsici TaxID=1874630 RepID=UPI00293F76EC|nr:nucleotidyltransferase domain-containing protein [Clavibacter capsici]